MNLIDSFRNAAKIAVGMFCVSRLSEQVKVHRAVGHIQHIRDGKVIWEQTVKNVKTKVGIDYTFAQTYGTSAAGAGLNYIALSNDALTETVNSTVLSNEIAANGLSRAQATYAHTNGQDTATLSKTFTCGTAPQAAQKAAVFSAASGGTMHHVLSFVQRSLQVNDQLSVTITLQLT
jgi:hypothetical protein